MWEEPSDSFKVAVYHRGVTSQVRSKTTKGEHSNQCTYDDKGRLMLTIPAAGSADYKACTNLATCWWMDGEPHYDHDVKPFELAQRLGRIKDYYSVRPLIY